MARVFHILMDSGHELLSQTRKITIGIHGKMLTKPTSSSFLKIHQIILKNKPKTCLQRLMSIFFQIQPSLLKFK